jgi:hypothetical protein
VLLRADRLGRTPRLAIARIAKRHGFTLRATSRDVVSNDQHVDPATRDELRRRR